MILNDKRLKVLHVVPGLRAGGAERILEMLVKRDHVHRHAVISLGDLGDIGPSLQQDGTLVSALGLAGWSDLPACLIRLRKQVRSWSPDIVHGWLYHGTVAAMLAPAHAATIAAFHATDLRKDDLSMGTRFAFKVAREVTRRVDRVVYCSQTASCAHAAAGFAARRESVIQNGVDTDVFQPSALTKAQARKRLGLRADGEVIGSIARLSRQKDHRTLLNAVERLHTAGRKPILLLCGAARPAELSAFNEMLRSTPHSFPVHYLGVRDDLPQILRAIDVKVLSSAYGEAMPLSLCEAMACKVPVVSTNVGDSQIVVGGFGLTVLPERPDALADAISKILDWPEEERESRTKAGREHICRNFGAEAMTSAYATLYNELYRPKTA